MIWWMNKWKEIIILFLHKSDSTLYNASVNSLAAEANINQTNRMSSFAAQSL